MDGQSKMQTPDGKGFSTLGDNDIGAGPFSVGSPEQQYPSPLSFTRNVAKHSQRSMGRRDKSLTGSQESSAQRHRHSSQRSFLEEVAEVG